MTRTYLVRGMFVGLVAGLFAFLFAKVVGERWVGQAIAFESAQDKAAGMTGGHELVSRTVQNTVGLGTGVLVFGVTIGGLFGLICAIAQGRVGRLGARGTALLIAALGFLSVCLVPFLKYPPNPPAIGNPDTIGHRTALYFIMIAASILLTVLCVALARRLSARHDAWFSVLVALGVFVVVVVAFLIVLPGVNEVPKDFPAVTLYRFRLASLGINLVVWTTLGLGFGWLTQRQLTAARRTAQASDVRGAMSV